MLCTSGSALLNYYPAIAESFYSDIPLVIISADRPAHLIDIGDGQTIVQENVFSNHILYSANLSAESSKQNEIKINEALHTSITQNGPVHINIPFEEPLYETVKQFSVSPQIEDYSVSETQEIKDLDNFISIWNSAKRKMVLVGVSFPNEIEQKYLDILANDKSVIVFTEATSNVHHENFFPSIDKIIATLSDEELKALQPEVLLTFGGMVVSKK